MKQIMINKIARRWFYAVMVCGGLSTTMGITTAQAEVNYVELPKAQDFKADAQQVAKARMPILVFFASESCPYCHVVEEDYLKPMFNSGEYRDKILFRKLVIDDSGSVRDFQGKSVDDAVFAKRYGISLTPHVKFIDADGQELVPGLLGLMTRDFYAGYLEDAINDAVAKLRPKTPPPA